jgi:urease accessory protein
MPPSRLHAGAVLAAGAWDAEREVDCVLVDYDRRHRRRILLTTEGGREVLLDLAHAARLRHGDGLLLEEGGVVRVAARPEQLADIHAHEEGDLVRIAWHLGNRHLPVQLLDEHIRIRADHVIEAMIEQLGGRVEHVLAPFDPEAGAYAGGHQHAHDDDDGHRHE